MLKKIALSAILLLSILTQGCATYNLNVKEHEKFTVVMKKGDQIVFVWSTDGPVEFQNEKLGGKFKATGIIYFEP